MPMPLLLSPYLYPSPLQKKCYLALITDLYQGTVRKTTKHYEERTTTKAEDAAAAAAAAAFMSDAQPFPVQR